MAFEVTLWVNHMRRPETCGHRPRNFCKRKVSGDGPVFHNGEKMRKVDPWGILDGQRCICWIQLYKSTAHHGVRRIDDGRADQYALFGSCTE